jgi:hypothetical protein
MMRSDFLATPTWCVCQEAMCGRVDGLTSNLRVALWIPIDLRLSVNNFFKFSWGGRSRSGMIYSDSAWSATTRDRPQSHKEK